MEKLVQWLAGETEVLGENRPQWHFVHHKSNMTWPGANPGRRGGNPATNRLSHGTAFPLNQSTNTKFSTHDVTALYRPSWRRIQKS
jgi:hypothetical protein